jgi:hypothetical protein
MDPKLEKAYEIANYMATLAAQKHILKEEFKQSLIFYANGGTFTASRELINFVNTLVNLGNDTAAVLIDDNEFPIDVQDLDKFLQNTLATYHSAVNQYYTRYSQLRKSRTVESIMQL